MLRFASCLVLVAAAMLCAASLPWKNTDPQKWSSRDVNQILNNSPWSQPVAAAFALAEDNTPPPPPAIDAPQAGMPSPHNGSTDGRWDGGVSRVNRNGPPSLEVTVRWDSALPVRLALAHARTPLGYTEDQLHRDYVISISGLVPANGYNRPQLNQQSGDGVDARNPEEMLEGVMRYARLYPRCKHAILPDDVKLDNSTGTLRLFFPRKEPVTAGDKEVTFETRFGSMSVSGRFRLKDMLYQGNLEL
jgi:hypothetical protein